MKKSIMMIIAGIALAATTQAASINWSVGNFAVILESTAAYPAAGTSYYLVLDSYVAGITAAILDDSFTASTAGVLDVGTVAGTKGAVGEITATSSLLELGGTGYNYRVLVFDTVGGLACPCPPLLPPRVFFLLVVPPSLPAHARTRRGGRYCRNCRRCAAAR